MATLLALALAVSTLTLPASAAASALSPRCLHMASHCPVVALRCCGSDVPDGPASTPPPAGQTAPAPDVAPLIPAVAVIPVPVLPAEPPIHTLRQLVEPPRFYLLHATLLV
jgi:hypothetical protein